MGTHTPGPWKSEDTLSGAEVNSDTSGQWASIAWLEENRLGSRQVSSDEQRANARLVAAAPELLEALELFVDASLREVIVSGPHKRTEGEKVYASARAAIRKARGE